MQLYLVTAHAGRTHPERSDGPAWAEFSVIAESHARAKLAAATDYDLDGYVLTAAEIQTVTALQTAGNVTARRRS
jgi:hypothetical protein